MPKHQAVDGDVDALKLVMSTRINEAISQRPDLFRVGRGRLVDFAKRYGLMKTVAHRILTAESFASPTLLMAFAEEVGVPIQWLYGYGDLDLVNQVGQPGPTQIPIFGAPGFNVALPSQMLPFGKDARLICVAVQSNEFKSFARPHDFLLVERLTEVVVGATHAVMSSAPGMKGVMLVAITPKLRGNSFEVSSQTMGNATFNSKELVFDKDEVPDTGLLVLGQVVGRFCFNSGGLSITDLNA